MERRVKDRNILDDFCTDFCPRVEKHCKTMRDKTHEEQITRWAEFVRNNPDKWKPFHTEYINAQFEKSEKFYKKLAKTKEGKRTIIKLFGIRNLKGYPSLR